MASSFDGSSEIRYLGVGVSHHVLAYREDVGVLPTRMKVGLWAFGIGSRSSGFEASSPVGHGAAGHTQELRRNIGGNGIWRSASFTENTMAGMRG